MVTTTKTAVATGHDRSTIARRGGLTVLTLLAIIVITRVVGELLIPSLATCEPLAWPAVVGTALAVSVGATVVYAALDRFTERPDRLFTVIAGIVLVFSMVPLITFVPTMAGVTTEIIALMAVMHVAPAAAAVVILTRTYR